MPGPDGGCRGGPRLHDSRLRQAHVEQPAVRGLLLPHGARDGGRSLCSGPRLHDPGLRQADLEQSAVRGLRLLHGGGLRSGRGGGRGSPGRGPRRGRGPGRPRRLGPLAAGLLHPRLRQADLERPAERILQLLQCRASLRGHRLSCRGPCGRGHLGGRRSSGGDRDPRLHAAPLRQADLEWPVGRGLRRLQSKGLGGLWSPGRGDGLRGAGVLNAWLRQADLEWADERVLWQGVQVEGRWCGCCPSAPVPAAGLREANVERQAERVLRQGLQVGRCCGCRRQRPRRLPAGCPVAASQPGTASPTSTAAGLAGSRAGGPRCFPLAAAAPQGPSV